MRRRDFVALSVALSGFAPLSGASSASRPQAKNSPPMPAPANSLGVKALVFDTFGTVVDWRGSIIREGEQWGREKNLQIDWGKFADRWRAGYGPSMEKVRKGELPWTKLDVLHRMILDQLLVEFNITGLTEEEKENWTNVWHRLSPWPDAVEGLTRLKKNYVIATLSNGNVSLLIDMAKFAGLPWDTVFSAELFHHYKPDREVYLGAVELLSCKPSEVMMTAAHPDDLKAAQACGLKAGYVPRPLERGPGPHTPPPGAAPPATNAFDVVATDFIDLAAKLS
jgi:2-haloacid dehalogenase